MQVSTNGRLYYSGGRISGDVKLTSHEAFNDNAHSGKLIFAGANSDYGDNDYKMGPYIQGINLTGWGKKKISFFQRDYSVEGFNTDPVEVFSIMPNGDVDIRGSILATGEITQHSSLELKDVVDTRFLTLDELAELKPYSFYWKDKRDDKLHAGAVADYVMPILPEVISTDKDNIHSMNYANAAWVVGTSLTPYVSKHEEDIEWLKARVRYLEDKLKEC